MRHLVLVASLLLSAACAPAIAPHMAAGARVPLANTGRAKVVFLWPDNSCERGGYYTVATEAGRFVGNVYTGTRLEAELDAGTTDFVAFNPLVEEATGHQSSADVATLHADLEPGRTYFVRLAFGEWDERGPVRPWRSANGQRQMCPTNEAALVALTPQSLEWNELRGWLDDLDPVRASGTAGETWLRADPLTLETHVALAHQREHRYWPNARALATLQADDGVHVITDPAQARGLAGKNVATLLLRP